MNDLVNKGAIKGATPDLGDVSISLEFRNADDFFEVYLCGEGTPLLLSTIRRDVMMRNKKHAETYRELMKDIVAEGVKQAYGVTPTFLETRRP